MTEDEKRLWELERHHRNRLLEAQIQLNAFYAQKPRCLFFSSIGCRRSKLKPVSKRIRRKLKPHTLFLSYALKAPSQTPTHTEAIEIINSKAKISAVQQPFDAQKTKAENKLGMI